MFLLSLLQFHVSLCLFSERNTEKYILLLASLQVYTLMIVGKNQKLHISRFTQVAVKVWLLYSFAWAIFDFD